MSKSEFSHVLVPQQIIFQEKLNVDMDITWADSNTDLQSCLEKHFQTYTSNEMCPRCPNMEIPATLYIWKLPQIFVIHLGFFYSDGKNNNRFMEFPMEELDITNYLHHISADNELEKSNLIYSLYAILFSPVHRKYIGNYQSFFLS
uniref:ubiquitinyl hydrolase 1 n=2 Tax=Meloidogyne incognita group TaxID=654580 RepID=A0A914KS19_MELIC